MSYVTSSNRGLETSHALIGLVPRRTSQDVNLRAKDGGKEKAGEMSLCLFSFSIP